MSLSLRRACRCGHARHTHQHYRRGTDCGRCDCSKYHGGYVLAVAVGTPMPRWEDDVPVSPYPEPVLPEVEVEVGHARRAVGDDAMGRHRFTR